MACVFERRDDSGAAKAHLVRWYDLTRSACDEPVGRDSRRERTRDQRETEPSSTGHAAGVAGEALRTPAARRGVGGLMRGADPSKVTQVRRADARR